MKPRVSNLSSPYDARETPPEIIMTMAKSLRLGSWMRKMNEMSRIATGMKAFKEKVSLCRGENPRESDIP